MATFNEQKGQGTFQPVLSDPGGSGGDSGRTVPGPAASGVASAIGGVADIFNVLAARPLDPEHDSEELIANKGDLEAQLIGEVSLIAGQPITSGIVPGSRDEIAAVSAGYQQGRISRNEMNVRLASIVQRYVAGDPSNAKEYREIARAALGYTPSAQIAADKLADIQFETDRQRAATASNAEYAMEKYGYVVSDGLGGYDYEAMAEKGIQLRMQDGELDRLQRKANLLKTQAETNASRRLTEGEKDRIEYQTMNAGVTPLIEAHLNAANQAVTMLAQGNFGNMEESEWLETTSLELNQRRTAVSQLIDSTGLKNGFSQKTISDYKATALASFDSAIEVLTGDRSTIAMNKTMLDNMEVQTDRDFAVAAPGISKLNRLAGPETTANIIQGALDSNTQLRGEVNFSVANEVSGILGNVGAVIEGEAKVQDLSKQDRPQTVKGLLSVVEQVNQRPQRATDQQRQAYVIANAELISTSLNNAGTRDRSKAAKRLSTNANLSALEAYAANDTQAAAVGGQLRTLNSVAFQESARRIKPDTTARQLATMVATRGMVKPISFFPVFNPETGRVEIHNDRNVKATEKTPNFMTEEVAKMNNNLDAVSRLKNMGESEFLTVDDKEVRRLLATTAGLPIVGEETETEVE